MVNIGGQWALVTGASSGIGAAIAQQLARHRCHLILTARRLERLEQLATALRAAAGIEVVCLPADLSTPDGAESLCQQVARTGHVIDILVNNAGFGEFRGFHDIGWERHQAMLQLNVTTLLQLCHWFVGHSHGRSRRAYILNIASIAADQPVPFFSNYAASKAYVRLLSESLSAELSPSNISVTCVSPGGTRTEFFDTSGQSIGKLAGLSMLTAQQVARISVKAMLSRRRHVVTGLINKINCFLLRFVPRRLAAAAALMVLGKPASALALPGDPSHTED